MRIAVTCVPRGKCLRVGARPSCGLRHGRCRRQSAAARARRWPRRWWRDRRPLCSTWRRSSATGGSPRGPAMPGSHVARQYHGEPASSAGAERLCSRRRAVRTMTSRVPWPTTRWSTSCSHLPTPTKRLSAGEGEMQLAGEAEGGGVRRGGEGGEGRERGHMRL